MLHRKVFRVPVPALLALLVVASLASAVLLGNMVSKQATIREADATLLINGDNSPNVDIAWSNLFQENVLTAGVASSTYTGDQVAFTVFSVNLNCTVLSGYGMVFKLSADGTTYGSAVTGVFGGLVNSGPSPYPAGSCVFYDHTVTTTILASNPTAAHLYGEFTFTSATVSGVSMTWTAQWATGASP